MGLIQTTMAPALWINYTNFGRAHLLWVQLEADFGKRGEHQLTSRWSTWWKLSSLIWLNCYCRFNNSWKIITGWHQMDTANFPKIWLPSYSVPVFHHHMNKPLDNIWMESLPSQITKFRILLHKFYRRSLEERLNLYKLAPPSISFQLWKTMVRNVLNVEKWTTAHKITGQGDKIWTRAVAQKTHHKIVQKRRKILKRQKKKGN